MVEFWGGRKCEKKEKASIRGQKKQDSTLALASKSINEITPRMLKPKKIKNDTYETFSYSKSYHPSDCKTKEIDIGIATIARQLTLHIIGWMTLFSMSDVETAKPKMHGLTCISI